MARAIELNLNSPEMLSQIPESGETNRERPDFDQIGSENLKWASEKVKGVKNSIWGGLTRCGKRVMSAGKAAYSETKMGVSEAYSDIKQNVKEDVKSVAEAAFSVPARAEYMKNVTIPETAAKVRESVDNAGMRVHEGIVGAKDSVVEAFKDEIIKTGEAWEQRYESVSSFAMDSYKGLEGRAMSAYEKMSSRVEAASQRRKDKNLKEKQLKFMQARREMLEAATEAGYQLY